MSNIMITDIVLQDYSEEVFRALNRERGELIDKEIHETITIPERHRLLYLNGFVDGWIAKKFSIKEEGSDAIRR